MSDIRQSLDECERLLDGLLARLAEAEAKVKAQATELAKAHDDLANWRIAFQTVNEENDGLRDKIKSMSLELITAHGEAQSRMEERDALQRAIDAALAAWDNWYRRDGIIDEVEAALRPHTSKSKAEKPPRQWSSTPPSDRSGKWWHAFKGTGDPRIELVPDSLRWDFAELKSACYNLWLPWEPNDTMETLPPLPVMATVGEIRQGKPSTGPLGKARDIAMEQIAKADAERIAVAHSEPQPAEPKAEECLRLVARLANAFVGFFEARECPNSVDVMASIAADARKAENQ